MLVYNEGSIHVLSPAQPLLDLLSIKECYRHGLNNMDLLLRDTQLIFCIDRWDGLRRMEAAGSLSCHVSAPHMPLLMDMLTTEPHSYCYKVLTEFTYQGDEAAHPYALRYYRATRSIMRQLKVLSLLGEHVMWGECP